MNRRHARSPRLAFACMWIATCIGCDQGPALVPVTGSIQVAGKPLAGGRILLEPLSADGGAQSAIGDVTEDGTFTLFTHEEGDGVAPGIYYPVVMGPKQDDDQPTKPRQLGVLQLPERHLEVTVDGPNDFPISISPRELSGAIRDD